MSQTNLPLQRKLSISYRSTSTVFLSTEGIKCRKLIFSGKNMLLLDLYLLLFRGHSFEEILWAFCATTSTFKYHRQPWRFYQVVLWRGLVLKRLSK
jgi:hypothetical protein